MAGFAWVCRVSSQGPKILSVDFDPVARRRVKTLANEHGLTLYALHNVHGRVVVVDVDAKRADSDLIFHGDSLKSLKTMGL